MERTCVHRACSSVDGETAEVTLDIDGAIGEVQGSAAGVGGGVAVHVGDHQAAFETGIQRGAFLVHPGHQQVLAVLLEMVSINAFTQVIGAATRCTGQVAT